MRICLLMQALARHATASRGVGKEALETDFAAAIDAVAKIEIRQAFEGFLYFAYFPHLAVHDRRIQIDQHVGHRVIARIRRGACQIGIMLVSRAFEFAADFFPQLQIASLQYCFNLPQLIFGKVCHGRFFRQ
jgi:hypothetical protein